MLLHRLLTGLLAWGQQGTHLQGPKQQQQPSAASWEEPHVMLLKGLLDFSPGAVLQQLHMVLPLLHEVVAVGAGSNKLCKNVKFVQLLGALLTKAGSTLGVGQLQLLHRTVAGTQTFMTKGLLSKIVKYQEECGMGRD
jgi:hypothetical protein